MEAGITDPVDITVIAVYFGFVILVGLLVRNCVLNIERYRRRKRMRLIYRQA